MLSRPRPSILCLFHASIEELLLYVRYCAPCWGVSANEKAHPCPHGASSWPRDSDPGGEMQAARGVSHRAQGSGPLYYSWGQGQCSLITAIISRDLFPSKPGHVQCCNTPSVHHLLYSHSSLFRNLPWPRNSALLQAEPNLPSKHLVAAPGSPLGSS